jgi:hypothetical protein
MSVLLVAFNLFCTLYCNGRASRPSPMVNLMQVIDSNEENDLSVWRRQEILLRLFSTF